MGPHGTRGARASPPGYGPKDTQASPPQLGALVRHSWSTRSGRSRFQVPGRKRRRAGRDRRAGIRRRARVGRGTLVRHSWRMVRLILVRRRARFGCGALVRHSGTVGSWRSRFQVPGPRRRRAGRVRRAGIRRRARIGRGTLVRHSIRSKGYVGGQLLMRGARASLLDYTQWAFTVPSSGPEMMAGRTNQACWDTWAGPRWTRGARASRPA